MGEVCACLRLGGGLEFHELVATASGPRVQGMHISVDMGAALKTLTFHEISGVRLQRTRSLVASDMQAFKFRLMATIYNGTRYVTNCFLKCSKDFHDPMKVCAAFD